MMVQPEKVGGQPAALKQRYRHCGRSGVMDKAVNSG